MHPLPGYNKTMRTLIFSFFLLLLASESLAQRGGGNSGVQRKQAKKIESRWSLADWLAQKQRNQLMDQWLSMNTYDNPYEFFIEGDSSEFHHYFNSEPEERTKFRRWHARAGAYASIIGIEGGYEPFFQNRGSWDGSLNLRLLGTAQQNTNITLRAGLKTYSESEEGSDFTERFQNVFTGVQTTLYLTQFFGLEGHYHRLMPAPSNRGRSLQGENSRAYIFLDFFALRLFGGWNKEVLIYNDKGSDRRLENRDGYFGGIRIWF